MERNREVMIVDDDEDFASLLSVRISAQNAQTTIAHNAAQALTHIKEKAPDVILLDIGLPDADGIDLISEVMAIDPTVPIIMVTGRSDMDTAVSAIKKGAYDYIVKPIEFDALWIKVVNAIQSRSAKQTIANFERELTASYGFDQFVYKSEVMKKTVDQLKQLSESEATVLITGESGVGKELAARMLHSNGPRRLGPFVAVSCAAVPETLIENELFGHERGAFTDAFERQIGRFEHANGGTIFLDEIGELSPAMQTKLLRVLQDRSFNRIGGVKEIKVDVRVIAATNRDLVADVAANTFRADLFYRISVLPITIPPLRERIEDIGLLAWHFLKLFSLRTGKRFASIEEEAIALMQTYAWPGNVRELQNAIERAVVFGQPPEIKVGDLTLGPMHRSFQGESVSSGPLATIREMEAGHISNALSQCGWNITHAANYLGIGRDTLYRKMKQYGISKKKA